MLVSAQQTEEHGTTQSDLSILQIMESVIAPASDKLWEAYEPESGEQWNDVAKAAMTMLDAANQIDFFGDGYTKNAINSLAFKNYNNQMKTAAKDALQAIERRDIAGLQKAAEELYPPCEACHLEFNPNVKSQ